MVKIFLIPISVVLCLIVISLFHPQIMEPYATYDEKFIRVGPSTSPPTGSKDYESKSWHTPDDARYYRTDGEILPYHQDVIDHRGHSQETNYVSDVLSGNDGQIPIIDDFGNEYAGPSYHQHKTVKGKEGFWYDMNRLDDAGWRSGKLDDEFKGMLNNENEWRINLIKSNIKRSGWNSSTIPLTEEGFGNHRAPEYWNEVDYPIVTSNGLNMTSSFPQKGSLVNSMYKHPIVMKLWGEFDMLKPDDSIIKAAVDQKTKSRTTVSHVKKK